MNGNCVGSRGVVNGPVGPAGRPSKIVAGPVQRAMTHFWLLQALRRPRLRRLATPLVGCHLYALYLSQKLIPQDCSS